MPDHHRDLADEPLESIGRAEGEAIEEVRRDGAAGQDNLTRKVLSSAGALLMRSAWERLLSLVATLAIARLIVPRAMGEATLVLSIVAFATVAVDAGITTALVRRQTEPDTDHFATAARVQYTLAVIAVAGAAMVIVFLPAFGVLLFLDSLQLLTDPAVLRRRVMLQRAVDFKGLATADGAGVLARALVSLGVAYVDKGPGCLVLGDLSAAVVSAGIVLFLIRGPEPIASDVRHPVPARQLLGEAIPFQLFNFLIGLRDVSSSSVITALVGLSALGLFQFAYRAISPMLLIFTSLTQLAVPVGVHVVRGDPGAREKAKHGYLLGGLATCLIMLAIATPAKWLIPLVFGARWNGAVPLVFAMALAIVINGPAVSFGVGLILASDRPRFATWAALGCMLFFLAGLFGFSHVGGSSALSAAWLTSSVVEAGLVLYGCIRCVGVSFVKETLAPIPVFLGPYLLGRFVGGRVAGGWPATFASAGVALGAAALVIAPVAAPLVLRLLRAARGTAAVAG